MATGPKRTVTIAVAVAKGGVGKTTTAVCLADSLRRRGRRALVVDLDQQGNATKLLGARTGEGVASAYDVFTRAVADAREAVQPAGDGLYVLPGGEDRENVSAEMAAAGAMLPEFTLRRALSPLLAAGEYDYVVLDCPPATDMVVRNALLAADEVVAPVLVDGFSMDGVASLARTVSEAASTGVNPGLSIMCILPTQKTSGTVLARAFEESAAAVAAAVGTRVFEHREAADGAPARRAEEPCVLSIRRREQVRKSQFAGALLHDYAPACAAALDYEDLADAVDAYCSEKY